MFKEFKEFAMKGNVLDLAIGVIIGAAFGKIVESFVGDIIMPVIGMFGTVDFSNLYAVLKGSVPSGASLADAKKAGVVLGYGNFITIAINFLIIAFALFMVVKGINRMKRREEAAPAAPPAPTRDQELLTEIRDILKK
ncbi:large conductance mechanosensitive channel protein MscL [Reyranella sp. CPCC 100927]|uniref:large conductance mechanosensitive channel protein MscL n=1 Tax=Reyranella sp. CPCC 100927 TaxID=2599616 RepID=UPI0011B48B6D|nr:large conductance mechanosensitive channel protein MscL [Reyranella sp. CPCC 100927]TWS94293.1 large conductance mechanosensitive channel protein MscL [Reyranella sp. CPCC 100927]